MENQLDFEWGKLKEKIRQLKDYMRKFSPEGEKPKQSTKKDENYKKEKELIQVKHISIK